MFSAIFGSDAGDGVHEQAEQIAFGRRHEAIEHVRVLANDQVGEQFHVVARQRQFVKRRQRNQRLVTDAIDVDDHLRGQRFHQFAAEKGYHQIFLEDERL